MRGAGLFVSVELVNDRSSRQADGPLAARVVNGMRRAGVLLSASGPQANCLKIRPPLVFSRANADELLERLDAVLASA